MKLKKINSKLNSSHNIFQTLVFTFPVKDCVEGGNTNKK
jgi:hypothetical protein